MSCAKSTFGTPGSYNSCPAGEVLVGVDLVYSQPAGFSVGRIERFGDHDAEGGFEYYEGGAPPTSGVHGLTAFYCANAATAAAGTITPTRHALALTPTPTESPTTFICPAGQALTGANVWANSTTGPIEQIQFNCNAFAPGTATGAKSGSFPSTVAATKLKNYPLTTLASPPTAIFANGIAQGSESGALNALGFGCQDYADEFDSSSDRQLACCRGTTTDPQLCGGFDPQSTKCDTYMTKYCTTNCSSGSCLDPTCGCLGSLVGRPECYDSRCADTPAAYFSTAQKTTTSCPTTASCDIWHLLDDGRYLAKKIPSPGGCNPVPPGPGYPKVIAVIVFLILLIFLSEVVASSSKAKALPPVYMTMPAIPETSLSY